MEEELAALAHKQWKKLIRYLIRASRQNQDGSLTVPPDKVVQWTQQLDQQYSELPEQDKCKYRIDAQEIMDTANTCLGIVITKERKSL